MAKTCAPGTSPNAAADRRVMRAKITPSPASNRTKAPGCLVEQVVNASLGEAFDEAEALLMRRLGHVTLADLSAEFNRKYDTHLAQHGAAHHDHPEPDL